MTEKWEYRNATRIYDESGLEVAQVSAECGLKTMRKRAHLIASTPELLEVLKQIVLRAPGHGPLWHGSDEIELARAAIAKARGGAA